MNRKNRHERHLLDLCPVCGMDSGERVQSTDAPFKHYVRCSTCGAITAGYAQQSKATKAWKRGMRGNEDLSGVREMFHRHEPQCV